MACFNDRARLKFGIANYESNVSSAERTTSLRKPVVECRPEQFMRTSGGPRIILHDRRILATADDQASGRCDCISRPWRAGRQRLMHEGDGWTTRPRPLGMTSPLGHCQARRVDLHRSAPTHSATAAAMAKSQHDDQAHGSIRPHRVRRFKPQSRSLQVSARRPIRPPKPSWYRWSRWQILALDRLPAVIAGGVVNDPPFSAPFTLCRCRRHWKAVVIGLLHAPIGTRSSRFLAIERAGVQECVSQGDPR